MFSDHFVILFGYSGVIDGPSKRLKFFRSFNNDLSFGSDSSGFRSRGSFTCISFFFFSVTELCRRLPRQIGFILSNDSLLVGRELRLQLLQTVMGRLLSALRRPTNYVLVRVFLHPLVVEITLLLLPVVLVHRLLRIKLHTILRMEWLNPPNLTLDFTIVLKLIEKSLLLYHFFIFFMELTLSHLFFNGNKLFLHCFC